LPVFLVLRLNSWVIFEQKAALHGAMTVGKSQRINAALKQKWYANAVSLHVG